MHFDIPLTVKGRLEVRKFDKDGNHYETLRGENAFTAAAKTRLRNTVLNGSSATATSINDIRITSGGNNYDISLDSNYPTISGGVITWRFTDEAADGNAYTVGTMSMRDGSTVIATYNGSSFGTKPTGETWEYTWSETISGPSGIPAAAITRMLTRFVDDTNTFNGLSTSGAAIKGISGQPGPLDPITTVSLGNHNQISSSGTNKIAMSGTYTPSSATTISGFIVEDTDDNEWINGTFSSVSVGAGQTANWSITFTF